MYNTHVHVCRRWSVTWYIFSTNRTLHGYKHATLALVLILIRNSVQFIWLSITLNASYLVINLKNNFHRLHFNDLLRQYIDIVSGPWEPFYTFPVESCLCLCLFCCYINTIFMCNILYFLQAKVIYCFIYIVRESSKGLVNRFMKLKKNKYETLLKKLYASAVGHSNKTETFTTANLLKSEISQVFDVCLISV